MIRHDNYIARLERVLLPPHHDLSHRAPPTTPCRRRRARRPEQGSDSRRGPLNASADLRRALRFSGREAS
jgi:hypothetical protein